MRHEADACVVSPAGLHGEGSASSTIEDELTGQGKSLKLPSDVKDEVRPSTNRLLPSRMVVSQRLVADAHWFSQFVVV